MAPGPGEGHEARDKRARVAVSALFLTNGALFANLLPRYPEIKSDLAMSNTLYGAAVASFSAGALVAAPTAAVLIRRFQSAPVAVTSSIALAGCLAAAGSAASPLLFGLALFAAGAGDAITDVAQNAHGLRLQRRYRRSIINSLHAVWALGAIIGGLMGAAAIALDVARPLHLVSAGIVFGSVVVIAYPYLLRGPDHIDRAVDRARDDARRPSRQNDSRFGTPVHLALLALVGLAVAGATVEDAGSSWATVYLREALGAPGPVAAMGFVSLVGFMVVGRLAGDRLVDRFGERAVARTGGLITAAGMGIALALPTVPGTIAGFGAAGLGVATVVPAAMRAADELPGLRAGTGLTAVTWLMRGGFLAAPLVVGVVADAADLRTGLLIVPLAGITLMVLAGALDTRRPR
ncbi:MAG: MFS transporter [Mycolicibacterium sp.]|uniref:MFS transporter n=1 Tax=Mycolicibacterium sp. TaxID=2320850 RepID=UPI003D0D5063